jgi:hypothetical protein
MIIIPLDSSGARRISVDLLNDLGVYEFRSYWNDTMKTWNLDIYDDAGNDVIIGLPLVIGINILKAHPDISSRLGQLRVFSDNADNNRTNDDLGDTAQLVHYPPGEFESLYSFPSFLPVQVVKIEDVTQ